ncbi:hypothetical protein CEXT_374231 [Caerostris extrusa]|uniref:Uncharacterized protein n=1 Tax=Caerostris extrusa TaxID=172846 RepID=A0AAV4YC38_CAEEX|nr:hypothetical protein CEXT_374231 [Caerostris extrusa]
MLLQGHFTVEGKRLRPPIKVPVPPSGTLSRSGGVRHRIRKLFWSLCDIISSNVRKQWQLTDTGVYCVMDSTSRTSFICQIPSESLIKKIIGVI